MNRDDWSWFLLLSLHAALAALYAVTIPHFRGPDEESHYRYLEHLDRLKSLPRITRPGDPDGTRDERTGAIAIHPPLYYAFAWPVYRVAATMGEKSALRALRFLAVALGIGTLFLTRQIARMLFPDLPHLVLAIVAFVALLPHFLLLSSVSNNDGLFILLNTALIWSLCRLPVAHGEKPPGSWRPWVVTGFLYGLTLLTKGSAVSLFPLMIVVALLGSHTGEEYSLPRWIVNAFLLLAPAGLVAGWWYLWYMQVHGRLYLIPKAEGSPLIYDSIGELWQSGNAPVLLWRFIEGMSKSIWSQVDWILPNDPAHPEQALSAMYPASYVVWVVFVALLGMAFLANALAMGFGGRRLIPSLPTVGLLYLHFGCFLAALLYSTLFIHPGGFQGGRYLLPGVAGLATFVGVGVFAGLQAITYGLRIMTGRNAEYDDELLDDRPRVSEGVAKALTVYAVALTVLLLFWNLCCYQNLTGFLIPAYAG